MVLPLLMFGVLSCSHDDDEKLREREQRLLEQYLNDNNITQEPRESGLYYLEREEGDGPAPQEGNYIIMEYRVRLITGRVIETTDEEEAKENDLYNPDMVYGSYKFNISNTPLEGVREGLSLMKEGGEARLIIPSELAYGAQGTGNVPPFSTLIFDIKLKEVIDDPERHERRLISEYVEENNITEDPDDSGLYYIEKEEGLGDSPKRGFTAIVHYTGWFIDGRQYNTTKGGQPFEFNVGDQEVTPGFEEGIKQMKPGGKAKFIVPSWIGYGSDGTPDGRIPPYMTLIYEVELIEAY